MSRLNNKFFAINSHTTTSGSNLSEYWPGLTTTDKPFNNPGYKQLRVYTNRTAETGVCTLDVILQELDVASNLWIDCRGQDGNVVDGVTYTDGLVETTAVHKLVVGNNVLTDEVAINGYAVINTVEAWFNYVLPQFFRIKFLSGGTTVTNTFSATIYLLDG